MKSIDIEVIESCQTVMRPSRLVKADNRDYGAILAQVFLSHLHSDHITDLAPLYAVANGRQVPLEVWGPSGAVPATGTNATIEGLKAVSFPVDYEFEHPPHYVQPLMLRPQAQAKVVNGSKAFAYTSVVAWHTSQSGLSSSYRHNLVLLVQMSWSATVGLTKS